MNSTRHRFPAGRVGAVIIALGACAGAVAGVPACQPSWIETPRCRDIPTGGCPRGGKDACSDPACTAIYACELDETWRKVEDCPAHPGADGGADGGPEAGQAVVDGGVDSAARDPLADAPPGASGGPGCGALEAPDCPLATALLCTSGACCGCEDLFVCQGGGWNAWGVCVDGGVKATP